MKEPVLINDLVKQVIELDEQIQSQRESIVNDVDAIREEAIEKIRESERENLEQTRERCQAEYNEAIAEAQAVRQEYLEEAKRECEKIQARYDRAKEKAVREIVESLLALEE